VHHINAHAMKFERGGTGGAPFIKIERVCCAFRREL
jgi:hypothetical protein